MDASVSDMNRTVAYYYACGRVDEMAQSGPALSTEFVWAFTSYYDERRGDRAYSPSVQDAWRDFGRDLRRLGEARANTIVHDCGGTDDCNC